MDEEHLNQAGIETNVAVVEAEGSKHSGKCREGHSQIIEGEHREEVVHGLVQSRLPNHQSEDAEVAYDGNQVEDAENQGNPGMASLHPWNACQLECGWLEGGIIEAQHGRQVGEYRQGLTPGGGFGGVLHFLSDLLSPTQKFRD